MPRFNGGLDIYDYDDIELLEVRHKRGTRANCLEANQSNLPTESQTQATPPRKQLFREALHNFRSKTLYHNDTNKETTATSKLVPEDDIMTDTVTEVTEKGFVELPSLDQILPKRDHATEPEGNIDRPCYNKWVHHKGFVAWWDNRTGKGMIIDYRYHLEHKIELNDIKYSNYGALVPGSMVEYEYSDDGISKIISKFWVVSGCEHVL